MPEIAPSPSPMLPLPAAGYDHAAAPGARRERRLAGYLLAPVLLAALGTAGWFGWEHWQLMQRQAAAPVVSIADDGTVRLNGQVLEITADGQPPKALEVLEGGPPEEEVPDVPVTPRKLQSLVGAPQWYRYWRYPRLGLRLFIVRVVEAGAVSYEAQTFLGNGDQYLPCMLEFRGRRWWLGRPGPLGPPSQASCRVRRAPGERMDPGFPAWILANGDTHLNVIFQTHGPFLWMQRDWLSTERLQQVTLMLPPVPGGTVAEKMAAFEAGDPQRGW